MTLACYGTLEIVSVIIIIIIIIRSLNKQNHKLYEKQPITNDNKNNNNRPANHVARFVSRASQFLWWNRAVFYSVPETSTRKTGVICQFKGPYSYSVIRSPTSTIFNTGIDWLVVQQELTENIRNVSGLMKYLLLKYLNHTTWPACRK